MLSSPAANAASSSTNVRPHDVIAFRTSAGTNKYLIGVVASAQHAQLQDGSPAVLVRPRPLILVPPQPSQSTLRKKYKTVKLAGQLVDRTDSAVAALTVTPLPSRNVSNMDAAANDEDTLVGMTTEELREMQEQRRGLQADLDTSKARVKEIDDALHANDVKKNNPPLKQPVKTPPITATARKLMEDTVRAADAAERELLLSRAGLRTVKFPAWSDLQRRNRQTSTQALVDLIETVVMLLHDPESTQFDDAVQQGPTLVKRLAVVKPRDVTEDDRTKASKFLTAWPTAETIDKEHKTAAALYRWLTAVLNASKTQKDLQKAQSVVAASLTSGKAADPFSPLSNSASPDPVAREVDVLTTDEEDALHKERQDQLEYVQMAEEEIAVLDALIAEANALAFSPTNSLPEVLDKTSTFHESSSGSPTIVPALTVPASLVVCVFTATDAPSMDAYAAKPRGTHVTFSLPSSHKFVAAVRGPASAASPDDTTNIGVRGQTPNGSGRHREGTDEEGRTAGQSVLPSLAASSRCSSDIFVMSHKPFSPRQPRLAANHDESAAAVTDPLGKAKVEQPGTSSNREAKLQEKVRILERRLSAALRQNPKEAELQLLRDEVTAKRTELQRVTEERDRLLLERRERSMWGNYGSQAWRKSASSIFDKGNGNTNSNEDGVRGSSASMPQQPGLGYHTRQLSTPRDMVDRSIVDELEEQLTAAHQRISELQIEVSQPRKSPSMSVGISKTAETAFSLLESIPAGGGDLSDLSSKNNSIPVMVVKSPIRTVAQDMYDEVVARLQSVSAELETQRQSAKKLEEQLNSALHRATEAEEVVAAQKREMEEVWEKLEVAQACAEELTLQTEQRALMAQAQQQQSQKQQLQTQAQNGITSAAFTGGASSALPSPGVPSGPSGLPRPQMQSVTPPVSLLDAFHDFLIPSGGDAEVKSQANDDVATITTSTACGNASRLSLDAPARVTSAEAFPTFGGGGVLLQSDPLLQGGPYHRGGSASLQSRPVEQLSTIELRHEVHRLREEVERHQSGELRLAMDLQAIRDKQKAEHKRRRDARLARMQMLTRMQNNIAEVINKSSRELEAIPALLERGRVEADALMMKRRMQR